ncbi:MAG: NAD(P)/FAD-dependent oxidoreductase [Gammaproteobacteria bacterium]
MADQRNIVIVGAGPAGSIAGALLCRKGYRVTIVERDRFPRFCIGESLLPQCMEFIEEAGMLGAVIKAGFQLKTGAAFLRRNEHVEFCFDDKFTAGFNFTYQVQRDRFDDLLAAEAQLTGVEIRWLQEVVGIDFRGDKVIVSIRDRATQRCERLMADFVLDASGFGRVLPRLLDLEKPSDFPLRQALFTHIEDRIDGAGYNRNNIRIIVHPELVDVWYWLIPFSNGRCSLGVVGEARLLSVPGLDPQTVFRQLLEQEPGLAKLLRNSVFDTPINSISGYSANVKALHGSGFALLGNAGEFLDPVFSSGVTIAMKSASLAADILDRQFRQQSVDWQSDFVRPLRIGVETFRAFVTSWYQGDLQDVVFFQKLKQAEQLNAITQMICSVLAGYVWDEKNPYVQNPASRLNTLVKLCREPGVL